MGIFIIYIGIIKPLFHFEVSLVLKIINFNGIKKFPMYNYHLPCECDCLSKFQFTTHLLHFC